MGKLHPRGVQYIRKMSFVTLGTLSCIPAEPGAASIHCYSETSCLSLVTNSVEQPYGQSEAAFAFPSDVFNRVRRLGSIVMEHTAQEQEPLALEIVLCASIHSLLPQRGGVCSSVSAAERGSVQLILSAIARKGRYVPQTERVCPSALLPVCKSQSCVVTRPCRRDFCQC